MTKKLLCTGLLWLLAELAVAQSATQAVLVGRVVDKEGRPLPGVTVSATTSSVGMGERAAVTDAAGRYRISPLPPAADYAVLAVLPGYARVEVSPVDLDAGKTTTLNLSLYPTADATEKITVTARGEIVDLASTRTSTVFNSEFIEGLPILGRTYQDILTLAPGVTDVDGDGNPNVNGARDTDFQTRVDGANTTDPFTGFFGQNLNLESIAEIEVITSGASAEFSQAQGGFANIITKSGGNDFEGSLKMYFRSDLFDNDGANNNDVTDENLFAGLDGFQDFRPFLTVGGPIIRDKLWYFVALEFLSLEEPVNTLTRPALLTEEGWNNFAKISWQLNPSHRMAFQGNHDPRMFTGLNLDTRTAPESDFSLDREGYSATIKWSWNLSPNLLLETLASRLDADHKIAPRTDPEGCILDDLGNCNPFLDDLYTIDLRQGLTTGPYFQTVEDERLRNMIRSDLSFYVDDFGGSHNLKAGFEVAREGYSDRVTTREVRFDDFLICIPLPEGFNDPADPNYIPVGNAAFGQFCNPNDIDVPDDIQPGEDPITIGSVNFESSVPGVVERQAEKDSLGLYVQDSFKPLPNLAINVGLRYDREEASALGWDPFDPAAEAAEFIRLAALGTGAAPGNIIDAFLNPYVLFDINGDGLDPLHCTAYDLDGAAFGDGMPDGAGDDFWTYFDGDFDGVADADNPFDVVLMVPDGQPDGISQNPVCDRLSDDVFFMLASYSRHQFDDTAIPFQSLVGIAPARGLPGTVRQEDNFTIVNNNIAPRLSVSWDPWNDNRTKLFATWGRYYDRLFLATLVPEEGPDPRTRAFFTSEDSFGSDAVLAQDGRFSITQVDRNMSTPFTDEFTIGFERELAPEWVIGLTYIRRQGRDQLQDIDLNHFILDENGDGVGDDNFGVIRLTRFSLDGGVDPTTCFGDNAPGPLECFFASAPDGQPDLVALNPFFNQVLRVGNFNESDYESYQLVLTRRLSRKWQMTSSYVWSRAVGDAEQFISDLGNDPGTVDDEFGPLSFDRTHVLKFSGVTYLPHDQLIGTTVQWASGTPYSTILQRDSADFFGSFYFRTTFPTEQRNDQRNEAFWNLDVFYKKSFGLWALDGAVGLEVINLLQSDDATIESVEPTQLLGLDATRRFGRRWQVSLELHF